MYDADQAIRIGRIDHSVTHEAAGRSELAVLVDRGHCVADCERAELLALRVEERIGADHERAGLQLTQAGEGRFEFAFGAGLQDVNLNTHAASRCLEVPHQRLGKEIGRIDEHRNEARGRNQFMYELEPLRPSSAFKVVTPVRLPPGRLRLTTRPSRTGSTPTRKTIGIVDVARHRRTDRSNSTGCDNYAHLTTNQIGRKIGIPVVLAFHPTKFDRYVLAFDIASFLQTLSECRHAGRGRHVRCRDTRSPASPPAARAPRAATPPPRRRAA